MSIVKGFLTAGVLVVAGSCAGFLLSDGSGHLLGLQPRHDGAFAASGRDPFEVIALGIVKAAGPGGEGEAAAKPPAGAAGEGAGETPSPGVLTGGDAAGFLAGNTVDASLSKRAPRLTYYAPRGLRADGDPQHFVVRAWNPKDASLCEAGQDGTLSCHPLQIRKNHADGAAIGEVLLGGGRWAPIRRGDLLNLPGVMPFFDMKADMPDASADHSVRTAEGQAAVAALIGHPAAIGSGDRAMSVLYLTSDGRRLTIRRPHGDADLAAGIAVSVGRWSMSKDLLCQTDGTPGAAPLCAKADAWGPTTIRLKPTGKKDPVILTILTETPTDDLRATN